MAQESALTSVSSFMGTGGRSAYAAVHGEVNAPKVPPASSTDTSDDVHPNENPFLASSDHPGTLPIVPKSIVEHGSDRVIVRLKRGENVVVIGLYSLWVKRGEISLLGASLPTSSTLHHVFVPVTHAIPSITGISAWTELEICAHDSGIRYMGDISRHFAGIWDPTFIGTTLSFHILGYHSRMIQEVSKELRSLSLEHWLPSIRQLLHRQHGRVPKVMVYGAKRTGKSTFCRIMINIMLTMKFHRPEGVMKAFPHGVILLDMDPGQPELAAPGIVYLAHLRAPLLGPSFANLIISEMSTNVMLRAHYIGAYTPGECPSHYQRCVADLLSLYRENEAVPLIINTCGWNTGSGKTILSSAVRGTMLTDIIHIRDPRNDVSHGVMPPDLGGLQRVVTQILPQPNREPLKSGRDFREMQLQVYLHASRLLHDRTLWNPLPVRMLRDTLPADLDISNEIFMIVMLGQDVVPEYLVEALEGSVVAIVALRLDSRLYSVASERAGTEYKYYPQRIRIAHSSEGQLPYLVYDSKAGNPLDPETSECIGLGLVTTVLSEKRQLRIKSPITAANIRARMTKGQKIAFVLARQQGLWSSLESILAREGRHERQGCKKRGKLSIQEKEYAESLSASTDSQEDPAWQGFFEELEMVTKGTRVKGRLMIEQ